jgi:hypothetical protein
LIYRCRSLGAVPAARAGVLGITFQLAYFKSVLVDISKQPAGGLTIETDGRNKHVRARDSLRPRFRIPFLPVIPFFPGREERQLAYLSLCTRRRPAFLRNGRHVQVRRALRHGFTISRDMPGKIPPDPKNSGKLLPP